MLSLPPCLIYNIGKPQTAIFNLKFLKLISKYRKPLGCVKPQYRSFCKIAQKIEQNRIAANPYTPFSTILACFFYRHATVASYRIPGELQGLYRDRKGERERATLELKLARDRLEPSVPIRKKKKTKTKLWDPG